MPKWSLTALRVACQSFMLGRKPPTRSANTSDSLNQMLVLATCESAVKPALQLLVRSGFG